MKRRAIERQQSMVGRHFGLWEVVALADKDHWLVCRCGGCGVVVKRHENGLKLGSGSCVKCAGAAHRMVDEIERHPSVSTSTYRGRIRRGWTREAALRVPVGGKLAKLPRKAQDTPALPPLRLVK